MILNRYMIICSSYSSEFNKCKLYLDTAATAAMLKYCIRRRMLCFRDSCNYSVSTKLLIFIFDAYVHAKNENVHFRYILSHASVKYFKFVFLWKLNLHNSQLHTHVARLQNLPLPISCVQPATEWSIYISTTYPLTGWWGVMKVNV